MKKIAAAAIISVITMSCATSSAQAAFGSPLSWLAGTGTKIMETIFPPEAESQDFKPYLENSRQSQNTQWEHGNWQPADWTEQNNKLIRDLYTAKIITDQDVDDDIPVLEVGSGFYKLGGEDKRRIVKYMDSAYNITASRGDGMIVLRDDETGNDVGVYTAAGLQLQ